MEVDLLTSGIAEEDSVKVDDFNPNSVPDFEGERCGICMDVIIDRGVLDCCQHWFCFVCIDNWATITNLCPLCQNEFQLITCVPVYDTIGSSKVDEDSYSRDDDWCIEGKNNTLSFPSYYIDENAVICLDGDGCKIRNGSANTEADPNLDTSIACDSCDLWYHAFCVGFDTEDTSENTWLCPRCVVDEIPQKPSGNLVHSGKPSGFEDYNQESFAEVTYDGKVSVSVADAGETALVVSMVGGNKFSEEPRENILPTIEVDKDLKTKTLALMSGDNSQEEEATSMEKSITQPVLEAQELELSLSHDKSSSFPSNCLVNELNISAIAKSVNELCSFDGVKNSSVKLFNESHVSNIPSDGNFDMGRDLGLSLSSFLSVDEVTNNGAEDQNNGDVKEHVPSEVFKNEAPADADEDASGITGVKRKNLDCSDQIHTNTDGDEKANIKTEASTKKMRAEGRIQLILPEDEADPSALDDSQNSPLGTVPSSDLQCLPEKEIPTPDIMSIVAGTNPRSLKDLHDKSSKEQENMAGLRVKKIMKRSAEDKESSVVVQELRRRIREAVRDESVKDFGENLFDPKLLAAFRTAVSGPKTDSVKTLSPSAVKLRKAMLQKGKVRENLTKKIYATSNGKRKRAWDRDCEVEFWKHRCLRAGKPEKIQTLKSVLNLLRDGSERKEPEEGSESKAADPILNRLYLADTSVFPRKDNIKPLAALKSSADSELKNKQINLAEKPLKSSVDASKETSKSLSKFGTCPIETSEKKNNVSSSKDNAASSKIHPNRHSEPSSLGSSKSNSRKEVTVKSDGIKGDKRKWAQEFLARKTIGAGVNAANESQEDIAVLKGNYPLLAQLPIDMRPALAPSRHNKIPMSVRQTQLYRLTEHLLRKANLPVIRRTAETELAVADAINIEKEVADRSNSKLVYTNLCAQELLHRSENSNSSGAQEVDRSLPAAVPVDESEQSMKELSTNPVIEEALRNAGLLSDSPPNSPDRKGEVLAEEEDPSINSRGEEPDNIFEMDNAPDLDIYGEFEYSLDDEDYIGASATKVSTIQPEGGVSKMKVVFSTLTSERSDNVPASEKTENLGSAEAPIHSSVLKNDGETEFNNSNVKCGANDSHETLLGKEGEEPSVAECEELYGPDKEPLFSKLTEEASGELYKVISGGAASQKEVANNSVGESSSNHSGMGETAPRKEKKSNADRSDILNSISKKVEAYIKEHIRPLCKSGIITAEQYRWAVTKATEKVMKYHHKAKNADFLIKEGEKVKKLAEQYVETAKQKGEK
ncbi:hypothetical protein UlMin_002463 [Ulmus minor]